MNNLNKKTLLVTVLKDCEKDQNNTIIKAKNRTGLWVYIIKKKQNNSVFKDYKVGEVFYIEPLKEIKLEGDDICCKFNELLVGRSEDWEQKFEKNYLKTEVRYGSLEEKYNQNGLGNSKGENLEIIKFERLMEINGPHFMFYSFNENGEFITVDLIKFANWGFNSFGIHRYESMYAKYKHVNTIPERFKVLFKESAKKNDEYIPVRYIIK